MSTIDARDAVLRGKLAPPTRPSELYRNRLQLIRDKISRHDNFSDFVGGSGFFRLTAVGGIKGHGNDSSIVVCGMLGRLKDGSVVIMDEDAEAVLDLGGAKMSAGIFCEGSFAIVQGRFDARTESFVVSTMCQPPIEFSGDQRTQSSVHVDDGDTVLILSQVHLNEKTVTPPNPRPWTSLQTSSRAVWKATLSRQS